MNALYLDLSSGISGDMFLGAALDLGVELKAVESALGGLGVGGWHLHVSRQARGGISGTRLEVHLEGQPGVGHDHGTDHGHGHSHGPAAADHHHHDHPQHAHAPTAAAHGRTFAEIREMIEASSLSPWARGKAVAVFRRVAEAEGKVHGRPADQVHFHEVGAVDSIVDIVGACVALDLLGRPRVLASKVVEGTGTVRCAHGRLPLPAPATLEILAARSVGIEQCDEPHELVTPTGAALLAEFAESFGPLPSLRPLKIGYGLGARENHTRPNVLRVLLGEGGPASPHDWETDTVSVLETNLDDVSAEILGGFVEKALAAGALDVFHTPIQMKKSRPGVLLTVLCRTEDEDRFSEMLLRETSAFGVRRTRAERRKLRREVIRMNTPFGEVEVKLGRLDGEIVQTAPEFESCRALALCHDVPLKTVYEAARRACNSDR